MRWATYVSPTDGAEHAGVIVDGVLHGLREPARLIDVLDTLSEAADEAQADPLDVLAEADLVLRAPIPVPPSIRDFMAFEEHVVTSMRAIGQEVDPSWYEIPGVVESDTVTSPIRRRSAGRTTTCRSPPARRCSTTSWRWPR